MPEGPEKLANPRLRRVDSAADVSTRCEGIAESFSKSIGFTSKPPDSLGLLLREIEGYFPGADIQKIIQSIRAGSVKSSTEFHDKLFWELLRRREALANEFPAVNYNTAKIKSPEDRKILEALIRFCRIRQIQFLAEDFGIDFDSISEERRLCAEHTERAFLSANTHPLILTLRDSSSSLKAYDDFFWAVLSTSPDLAKKFTEAQFDAAKMADAREREAIVSLMAYAKFFQTQFSSRAKTVVKMPTVAKPDSPRAARAVTPAVRKKSTLPSLRPVSATVLQLAMHVVLAVAAVCGGVKLGAVLLQQEVVRRTLDNFLNPNLPLDKSKKFLPQDSSPLSLPSLLPAPPESSSDHEQLQALYERVNGLMQNFALIKRLKEGTLVLFPQGCGAFVAAENVLVTAAHCFLPEDKRKLQGVETITINDQWNFSHKPNFLNDGAGMSHAIVYHPTLDVAVVVFSRPYFLKSRVLPIAERPIDVKSPVIHCGHPANQLWNLKGGYVFARNNGTYDFFVEVYPGSSGGPVMNEKGEVVSVMSSVLGEMVHVSHGPMFDRGAIMALIHHGEAALKAHGHKKSGHKPKSKL